MAFMAQTQSVFHIYASLRPLGPANDMVSLKLLLGATKHAGTRLKHLFPPRCHTLVLTVKWINCTVL